MKAIRTGLGLSQETFAGRYGIPVATLRQWEMARRLPDRASLSYLRVIASMPVQVAAACDGGLSRQSRLEPWIR